MITSKMFIFLSMFLATATLASPKIPGKPLFETRPSLLVDDFVSALEHFQSGTDKSHLNTAEQLWVDAFEKRDIKPSYIDKKLFKANLGRYKKSGMDRLEPFRTIAMETFENLGDNKSLTRIAMHALRIDVIEDYDDVLNDNIYCYFITTHDELVWGKVTSIYQGVDEGEAFFFSPADRGLFGPHGEKIDVKNHLIIDFGVVESDGEDIAQLQRLSGTILDLAVVALSIYNPEAGVAAAQARAETKNLMNLLISMDTDDRLITDTIHLTPELINNFLNGQSVHDFYRSYERETFWTHFDYRVGFRLLR